MKIAIVGCGFVEFVVANPDVHRNVLLYVRPAGRPVPDPLDRVGRCVGDLLEPASGLDHRTHPERPHQLGQPAGERVVERTRRHARSCGHAAYGHR